VKIKELLSKGSQVFFNNGIRQLSALIVSIYIAQLYGSQGRGEYALFITITTVSSLILSFGIVNSLIYQIKHKIIIIRQGVVLLILHTLIGLILALFLIWVLLNYSNMLNGMLQYDIGSVLILFSLYYMVTPFSLFIIACLLAIDNIKTHKKYILLISLATVISFVVTDIMGWHHSFHPVTLVVGSESIIVFFALFYLLSNEEPRPIKLQQIRKVYSYAAKVYFSLISSIVTTRVDNFIIPLYSSISSLGVYAAAKTFYNLMLSIPTAYSGYILGVFCHHNMYENVKICIKVMWIIGLISFFILILLFHYMDELIILGFGYEFIDASESAKLLSVAAALTGISSPINSLMQATNRPHIASVIATFGAVVIISLLFFLVPKYSYQGAAYSAISGAFVVFILRVMFLLKFKGERECC
jgi:O-antigen/teichoic acid export membrane protein